MIKNNILPFFNRQIFSLLYILTYLYSFCIFLNLSFIIYGYILWKNRESLIPCESEIITINDHFYLNVINVLNLISLVAGILGLWQGIFEFIIFYVICNLFWSLLVIGYFFFNLKASKQFDLS